MDNLPALLRRELEASTLPDVINAVKHAKQVEYKTLHHFAPHLYVREFHMPAESVCVGAKHRYEHMIMLVKGKATFWTERGEETFEAPHMHKSWAGCQRVIYAHEDVILVSFHPTDTTDLEELRKELIIDEVPLLEGDSQ